MNHAELVREYVEAVRALHETHGSTDVHRAGGIAGQAITRHCAWECGVLDARLNTTTMQVEGDATRLLHGAVMMRYEKAEAALLASVGLAPW